MVVTSRPVKAYLRRFRRKMVRGSDSRSLWGPGEGRGAWNDGREVCFSRMPRMPLRKRSTHVGTRQLVEHPRGGRCETLEVLLGSTSLSIDEIVSTRQRGRDCVIDQSKRAGRRRLEVVASVRLVESRCLRLPGVADAWVPCCRPGRISSLDPLIANQAVPYTSSFPQPHPTVSTIGHSLIPTKGVQAD